MAFVSVTEYAAKHNLPLRTVRNYCAQGKIEGAFITGKTWNIPEDASLPVRGQKLRTHGVLLDVLQEQKRMKLKGSIYHRVQVDLTYNSNKIEGSKLSEEQTRLIFETNTVGVNSEVLNVDDIIETTNHFRAIDFIIDSATAQLTESYIKELHLLLKSGTSDSLKDWFNVGAYKQLPNEVGGNETVLPEKVSSEMKILLRSYNAITQKSFEDIIDFHYRFECIHPFQDGNGRVGRLVMFKECLANNIVPFIINDEIKMFYYRGLQEWPRVKGFLLDTCLSAQDDFKSLLRYFRIDTSEV